MNKSSQDSRYRDIISPYDLSRLSDNHWHITQNIPSSKPNPEPYSATAIVWSNNKDKLHG